MEERTTYRVGSIDMLRGLVMIIMALDHTRDFFHVTAFTDNPLNLATTTVPLYFTRWATHFCAPVFVFLSGVSAYLASKSRAPGNASLFLVKRGLWLVFIEVAVITLGITFNPLYNFIIWQVIWAIGWSMVILGLLMRVSFYAVLVTGLLLFFGHNLLDMVYPQQGMGSDLLKIMLTAHETVLTISSTHFIVDFYAILPWTGTMLLGYCAGYWYRKEFSAIKRKQLLITAGISLIFLFMILRFINLYGDPVPWDKKSILSFLNANKYPPSLLYFCMTLGPALLALTFWEKAPARWASVFSVYGRVPFFYYVLHFYLLHGLLVIVFFATGHTAAQIVDTRSPFLFRPLTFGYGLWVVYAIWVAVVLLLYQPCRWFNKYKITHSQWWLKYL